MLLSRLSQDIEVQKLLVEIRNSLRALVNDQETIDFWRQRCYYPLVRDQCYPVFSENLTEIARGLLEDPDVDKKKLGMRLQNELRKRMDLFVQFIFEILADKAWGRNVGEPENKNLADLLRPAYNSNFREFYHQLCFIKSEKLVQVCRVMKVDAAEDDNGIIAYGYIDRSHGLSFTAVSTAKLTSEGTIRYGMLCSDISLRISLDSVQDVLFFNLMETNCDTFAFMPFIERTMIFEDNNPQLELMRQTTMLDPLRHAQYPDDISVVLYQEGLQPEKIWVRCVGCVNEEGVWLGKLLNEPYSDYGCHNGDKIKFQTFADDDTDPFCYFIGKAE